MREILGTVLVHVVLRVIDLYSNFISLLEPEKMLLIFLALVTTLLLVKLEFGGP